METPRLCPPQVALLVQVFLKMKKYYIYPNASCHKEDAANCSRNLPQKRLLVFWVMVLFIFGNYTEASK